MRPFAFPSAQGPVAITFVLCLAEVLGMLGFAIFPALLVGFIHEWNLSNTDAGWINGIFYAGYLVAVPVLTSLTDRIRPRRVYIFALGLTALSSIGFALLASGFWSAMGLRFVAGIGLAGTYMPGLKLLIDHVGGPKQFRVIAYYTSTFAIGSSVSFLMAGELSQLVGWAGTFALAALGPVAAFVILQLGLPGEDPAHEEIPDTHLLDFRPVLRARRAMGYVLAYATHSFELFALRSWIVAYLVFAAALHVGSDDATLLWSATAIAAALNLVAVPASVLGNELAEKIGRRKLLTWMMLSSAVLAVAFGFASMLPFWALVIIAFLYSITVMGDSSALTSGLIAEAPRGYRGQAMAVHSTIGFFGAFMGPLAFGLVLDAGAGWQGVSAATGSSLTWGLAFAAVGAVVALGPLALKFGAGRRATKNRPDD